MNPFRQSPLLKVGDPAPDFELPAQTGETMRLSGLLKRGWVVLFFYPRDHTPACTTQACAFRNAYGDFHLLGAEVIGISGDSPESHRSFARDYQLPFTLLTDADGKVRAAYGVPRVLGIIPGRVTYVIDGEGTIRMAYPSLFNAKAHMEKALALLRQNRTMPGS